MTLRHYYLPAAAALLLSACGAAPQASAESAAPATRTLTVTGIGEATAAPDMAVINIGVSTDGATAAAALRENSAQMNATIETLKSLGVADRDIQTSGLSVNPRYNYQNNRSTPELIGFNASNTVTIRLRDLAEAGIILDEAVQVGANTLSGVSFTFSEPAPLHEQARRDAVEKAQAQAALLSDAAGVRLGRVLTISDGHVSAPSPRPMMARMEAAADLAAPLQGGESSVTARVTIVYEIE